MAATSVGLSLPKDGRSRVVGAPREALVARGHAQGTNGVLSLADLSAASLAGPASAQAPPPPPPSTPPPVPPPVPDANQTDGDGDGVVEAQDACPTLAGPPQNSGCPTPPPSVPVTPAHSEPPPAFGSFRTSGLGITRARTSGGAFGLHISGAPFGAVPQAARFRPYRLTLWMPKGVSLPKPPKPCSEARVRSFRSVQAMGARCSSAFAGRVTSDTARGWEAFDGPVRNGRQRLFIRALASGEYERDETRLLGFGRGLVEPASAYETKVTLEMRGVGISIGSLEFMSLRWLRATSRCPAGRWRLRIETSAGSASNTGRARCAGAPGTGRDPR